MSLLDKIEVWESGPRTKENPAPWLMVSAGLRVVSTAKISEFALHHTPGLREQAIETAKRDTRAKIYGELDAPLRELFYAAAKGEDWSLARKSYEKILRIIELPAVEAKV